MGGKFGMLYYLTERLKGSFCFYPPRVKKCKF
jgi:hypothetical protein